MNRIIIITLSVSLVLVLAAAALKHGAKHSAGYTYIAYATTMDHELLGCGDWPLAVKDVYITGGSCLTYTVYAHWVSGPNRFFATNVTRTIVYNTSYDVTFDVTEGPVSF
jgi:hypothetical protein